MAFLGAMFKILAYPVYLPLLWMTRFFRADKRIPLFEAFDQYKAFLRLYYQRGSMSGIWKTHARFIPFMFWKEFPKSGIYRSFLACPFELASRMESIQTELAGGKYKELFIRDFEMDDFLITFSLV